MTAPTRVDEMLAGVRRTLAGRPGADVVAASVRAGLPLGGTGGVLSASGGAARDLFGAGPLEPLLTEPDVSDVLVNGPGRVWVDRGRGVEDSGLRISDERELRALAHRLVAAAGRRLDDASPFADARLPDGTRVHAVLPPVAPQGTTISLRVPPRRSFALADLVAAGSISDDGATMLRRLVTARVAFVVTGGTGTGKTTVLSTLLSEVDAASRIVMVEDAAELRPRHPHLVRLEARPPNPEGAGGVDLADLVRQALRMRPDRLVVGEVRGAEVVDLLAALNTGHEGGCATVHANRAQDLPARFEALGAAAGLSRATTHAQLTAGVGAVVHLRRRGDGRRVVDAVAVLSRDTAGIARADVAAWLHPDRVERGPAAGALDALLTVR